MNGWGFAATSAFPRFPPASLTALEVRDLIEAAVDEYLGGTIPRRWHEGDEPRVSGVREVFGVGHATVSYVSDPEEPPESARLAAARLPRSLAGRSGRRVRESAITSS